MTSDAVKAKHSELSAEQDSSEWSVERLRAHFAELRRKYPRPPITEEEYEAIRNMSTEDLKKAAKNKPNSGDKLPEWLSFED